MNGPIAPISLTGPPAIVALLLLWWYYSRLNRAEIPRSRRKIRQVSVVLMVAEVPLLLIGTSFTDHRLEQEQFVWVWLAAIVLLVLIMWMMLLDALNSLLLSRQERRAMRSHLIEKLKQAREEAQEEALAGEVAAGPGAAGLADDDAADDADST